MTGGAGFSGPPAQEARPTAKEIAAAKLANWRAPGDFGPMSRVMKPPESNDPKPNDGAAPRPSPKAAVGAAGALEEKLEPGLYVVATPIGNLRDITLRALDVLKNADLILAEDTRVTRKLLSAYGLSARVEAYHEHNADVAGARAVAALDEGLAVALASDAGTPLISDPGQRLVAQAVEAGHRVIPIPGASALLAGLAGSGLPTGRFLFAGFPPVKSGARKEMFAELSDAAATLVFFETGPRLAESLADMAVVFGDRRAAIGRELTKMFEEFRRAPLGELAKQYALEPQPKGELVVMVAPPPEAVGMSETQIENGGADADLRAALKTLSVREAAQQVAAKRDAPRRALYRRALSLKDEA
jgi:16S rRNA (cytidine1402-2'-O)-methyltransferase